MGRIPRLIIITFMVMKDVVNILVCNRKETVTNVFEDLWMTAADDIPDKVPIPSVSYSLCGCR
jgi:hypothetical protein